MLLPKGSILGVSITGTSFMLNGSTTGRHWAYRGNVFVNESNVETQNIGWLCVKSKPVPTNH
jgi:hypothetical protein